MKKHLLIITLLAYAGLYADDVVVTAQKKGYTAFHDAVHAADLYKHAKKKEGEDGSMAPFTVFVPTNEAFEKIASLDEKQKKGMITFHVAPGQKVGSLDQIPSDGIATVGEELLISDGSSVGLEESTTRANIIEGPIKADNGVLYIIDNMLTPAGMTLPSKEQNEPVATPETTPAPQQHTQPAPKLTPTPAPPVSTAQELTQPLTHIATALPKAAANNAELLTAMTQLTQSIQLLIHVIQQYGQKQEVVVEQVPAAQSLAVPALAS